jgi:hypothetical protein
MDIGDYPFGYAVLDLIEALETAKVSPIIGRKPTSPSITKHA